MPRFRNLVVNTSALADGAVTTPKIAALAVTTAKIADLAVTTAKITSLSASKITAGTIAAQTITIGAGGVIQGAGGAWSINESRLRVGGAIDNLVLDSSTWGGGVEQEANLDGGFASTGGSSFTLRFEPGAGLPFEISNRFNSGGVVLSRALLSFDSGVWTLGAPGFPLWRLEANGVRTGDGSAGAPAYSFVGDTDTGIAYGPLTEFQLVVGGVAIAKVRGGALIPGADNAQSLGISGGRWVDVWAVDGTINTSARSEKKHVDGLGFDPGRLIDALEARRFQRRPGGRRWHWGWVADEVAAALTGAGLDPARHGVYIDPAAVGEAGAAGLRPTEMIPVVWAELQRLRRRVAALE